MSDSKRIAPRGRAAGGNPRNRFESVELQADVEQLDDDEVLADATRRVPTEYFDDQSQSVVTENSSPDVSFRYSLNPYRGCSHGCSYCYARPSHEYLGWKAGLDFESKILVKRRAASLFRDWLARDRWVPETVGMSGITDCYQPAERQFQITRQCLQVALDARQPISIITKNALVVRDLDLLASMARLGIVRVALSITSLDRELARLMEPRTSTPQARLRAIERLREAGVPVQVMVAPVIPGLNDSEIPAILRAAAEAGASTAGYVLLRLPLAVRPVFLEWLERAVPERRERVESRIQNTRGGQWNDARFGARMRGQGVLAEQIQQTFRVFAARYGLDRELPPLDTAQFRPPVSSSGQMRLF